MLYEKIAGIICDQLGLEASEITRDTAFVADLGCDSLDIVELTISLEEEFGMSEIPEDDLKAIKTVGDLVDYAESHIKS